jgi:hypothetical protein
MAKVAVTRQRPMAEGANLVLNGDFTDLGSRGVPYGWNQGVFYGGADKGTYGVAVGADLRMAVSLSKTTDAMWESAPVPAVPGERYTLTAEIDTADATGENGVQILFLSGPGWGWKGGPTSTTITGTTGGWKTVTVTGTVPDDADVVRVNLVSKNNTGKVLFRNIRLMRPEPSRSAPGLQVP